jgi:hypothetical protein
MAKNGDRLGAVAAYFQQFEKEQDERRKTQNLKAAQRRKERAQALPNRTSLLGGVRTGPARVAAKLALPNATHKIFSRQSLYPVQSPFDRLMD